MARPTSVDTIIVTGSYVDFLGNAGTGTVTFEPQTEGYLKAIDVDVLIVPKLITVTLDSMGQFSQPLPYTNDPDVVPQYTYHVTEKVSGITRQYNVEIPMGLVGTVDISDLSPIGPYVLGNTALTRAVADGLYMPVGQTVVTSVAAGDITDSTPTGQALITAATAAAAKTSLGLATVATSGAYDDLTSKPSIPTLYSDLTGLVPTAALPSFTVGTVWPVATQAAMLAVAGHKMDIAIRTDTGDRYVLSADTPTVLAAWIKLNDGVGVPSVNGQTGVVVLAASDVGAVPVTRNIAGRPLSADITLAKADVGLTLVDNTSDALKPLSNAATSALAGKAAFATTPIMIRVTDYAAVPARSTYVPGGFTGLVIWYTGDLARTPEGDAAVLAAMADGDIIERRRAA